MGTTADHEPITRADLAELATALARPLTPLAELAGLLERPTPVALRPSDRIGTFSGSCSDEPRQMLAPQPDRQRVTIVNTSDDVTIYLAADVTTAGPTQTNAAFPLAAGATLSMETRAGVAMFCATGEVATWAAIAEQSDQIADA